MEDYIIEMRHITKEFPGIKANDDITLQLKKGEIHALLGENGAGKSTLMSVLFGLYTPDCGEILKNGQVIHIKNPNDATKYGIGMVHQHFMLVDCFTGLQNIILGNEPSDKIGFIHLKKVRKEIEALIKKYNYDIDLDAKVSNMTVGMQQKIEILKMLYRKNEVLIFDEPTAVLTPQEIEELMATMKNLAKGGASILFISHKLNEIMEVADRVTVLRKGKCIGTKLVKDTNVQELSRMMVGRDVQLVVNKNTPKVGDPVLSVRHLTIHSHEKHKNVVDDVSFDARAGEITCIAGIEGNGQSDLVYGITGLQKIRGGEIVLRDVSYSVTHKGEAGPNENVRLDKLNIRHINEAGVSHIPEDRHKYGLVLDFDLKSNMVLERFYQKPFANKGLINNKAIKDYSDKMISKYDIRSSLGSNSIARSMSGGNQQKAIVGRELDRDTPLLIAVQPTRGLDVGAIEFIHKEIVHQRDEGKAILLVSLELDEVMNLADRILVMYEGKIVADLNPKKTNYEEIGLYMSGAKKDDVPYPGDILPPSKVEINPTEPKKEEEKPVENYVSEKPAEQVNKEVVSPKEENKENPVKEVKEVKKDEGKKKEETYCFVLAPYSSDSSYPHERYFSLPEEDKSKTVLGYGVSAPISVGGKISFIKLKEEKKEVKMAPVKKEHGVKKEVVKSVIKKEPVVEEKKTAENEVAKRHGKLTKEELYQLRVNNLRPYWKKKGGEK